MHIAARDLVVGGMVLLAEGDRVPADMQLLEVSNLAVDESLLTGESDAVVKEASTGPVDGARQSVPREGADDSLAFSGTLVTRGTARGAVVATGERSALGRIGQSLAGIDVKTTPIQQETRRVVKLDAWVGQTLAAALAVVYWITHDGAATVDDDGGP